MTLEPLAESDLELVRAISGDPEMMKDLGGPLTEEGIVAQHRRFMDSAKKGDWAFKVVPDPGGPAAGIVCLWDGSHGDGTITEMGWLILPAFQRRGLATAAAAALIARARAEKRATAVHAFPAVSNPASNAICAKLGFEKLGVVPIDYAGRTLTCRHWRLTL